MATVRCGVENDVIWAALDATFQYRFEGFVRGVFGVERKIVAEHDKAEWRAACQGHQRRQAVDVFAMNLDQLERAAPAIARHGDVDAGMAAAAMPYLARGASAQGTWPSREQGLFG